MRAAVIFGLGCSQKTLTQFQIDQSIDWHIGMPAAPDQADVILLFGGDGTIHWHLGQLVALGLPVLVVPAGSGNDFARALSLRRVRDSVAAWRKFCQGPSNVRTIDLGVITQLEAAGGSPPVLVERRSAPYEPARNPALSPRYFCCVAGVGLDGEVARRANTLPRWLRGHGGYVLSLAPAILRFAALPMKILTPMATAGEPRSASRASWEVRSDQPTILTAFANTPTYGGGMKIAPHAQMDDGLFDVCIVGGIDPFKLACMFPTIYFGRHLRIREVQYFSTASARIETEHALDVYADGEYVCRTPVEVNVEVGALRVLTP
jgi:diacylglycerol kinase (ATP)